MKYNIIDIHNKIMEYFSKEDIFLPILEKKKEELEKLLTLDLANGIKKEISQKIEYIDSKVENILSHSLLDMYTVESRDILSEYRDVLNIPQTVNFMGKKTDSDDTKKNISKKYINMAREYLNSIIEITRIELTIPTDIYNIINSLYDIFINYEKHTEEKKKNNGIINSKKDSCDFCGGKKFEIMDQDIVCKNCANIQECNNQFSCYNEVDRVSISSNYSYDRKNKFRDKIYQYQGKQKCKITNEELDVIEKECIRNNLYNNNYTDKNRFKNLKKLDLIRVLQNLGKHYEQYIKDIHYIHWKLTGLPRNDISHLEQKLMDDFEVLVKEYFNNHKNKNIIDRKSFINNQIIFYELLLKYGYPCNKEDFTLLKTVERLNDQDSLCQELFQSLNWKYYSIF